MSSVANNSEPFTPIGQVKTFDQLNPELKDIKTFVEDIQNTVRDDGELQANQLINLPQKILHTTPFSDHDKQLFLEEHRDEADERLFYTDLIQLLSDSISLLLALGSKSEETLSDYAYLKDSQYKHYLLKEIAGLPVGDKNAVSEDIAYRNRHLIYNLLQIAVKGVNAEFLETDQDQDETSGESITKKVEKKKGLRGLELDPDVEETEDKEILPPPEEPPPSGRTREELDKIQYEATWIYNRALHELFVSQGIDYTYLAANPQIKDLILEEAMSILLSRDPADINLLFANPRRRLEILDELYLKLSRSPQFTATLSQYYQQFSQSLPEEERGKFIEEHQELIESFKNQTISLEKLSGFTTDYNFRQELKDVLKTDSPIVVGLGSREYTQIEGRVQVALKSLLLTQGADFDFINIGDDGQTRWASYQQKTGNARGAVWLLANMSDQHLMMMLGLGPEFELDDQAIARLRQILIRYARIFAAELALEAENAALANGLAPLNENDADKIANQNNQAFSLRLMPVLENTREAVKEHGADRVAKSVFNNAKQQQRQRMLQWNSLSDEEKNLIYQYLGYKQDEIYDRSIVPDRVVKLNFLELQIRAREDALAAQIIAEENLFRLAQAEQEALYVAQLQQYLTDVYIAETKLAERELLRDHLELQNLAELRERSLYELMAASEEINGGPAGATGAKRGGIRDGLSALGNRFGGRFRGKGADPKSRALSALQKAGGDKLLKQALSAAGPWGRVAKAVLDKDSKERKLLVGGLIGVGALALQALAKMLSSAAHFALGVGGAIVGGTIAAVLGAPVLVIVAAGVVGASVFVNFGPSLLGWSKAADSSLGLDSSSDAYRPDFSSQLQSGDSGASAVEAAGKSPGAVEAAQLKQASGFNPAATATNYLAQMSIGSLAAGGTMLSMAITAAISILIIMAAFFGPLPASFKSRVFDRTLAGFEGCWPTTGRITTYLSYPDGSSHATLQGGWGSYSGEGVAIDIGTGANSAADGSTPPIFTPFTGTAYFYPQGTGICRTNSAGSCVSWPYGNYVVVDTGQFALLFAHMLDFPSGVSMSNITEGVNVSAGEFIGRVDSTGNSSGNHLHYEVIGANILDIIPITDEQRSEFAQDERKMLGLVVNSQECAAENVEAELGVEGYIAIGPKTADNVVVTESNQARNPQYTCDWFQTTAELDVAINGNFFTQSTQEPIGPGGSNPVVYFANADGVGADGEPRTPAYMGEVMRYFGIDNNGSFRIEPILSSWYNRTDMPFIISNLQKAVAGVNSQHPDIGGNRNRVAIGYGRVNRECTNFTGDAVIMGAVRSGTYSDLRRLMERCGADEFVFMDAGGSASFCSENLTIRGDRRMPINIGLKDAEVKTVSEPGGD